MTATSSVVVMFLYYSYIGLKITIHQDTVIHVHFFVIVLVVQLLFFKKAKISFALFFIITITGYCLFSDVVCNLCLVHPTSGECILGAYGTPPADLLNPMPTLEDADVYTVQSTYYYSSISMCRVNYVNAIAISSDPTRQPILE